MQLSYSKLSVYHRCGFQYRLRYVERIPSRPKAHFRFGSVLHSVLGKFYRYAGEGKPSLEYLLGLFEDVWPTDTERHRRSYDLGIEVLREYYRANIATWSPPVWVECTFNVPIGRHSLQGVFDRVDRVGEDRYRVIDYKAGTVMPSQEDLDNDLQLSLYGLAFWKMAGSIPEELVIYHLRENVALTTVRTLEDLEKTERQILEVGDRMSRKEGWAPQESEECRWCDYVEYCAKKTESPIPVYDQLDLGLEEAQPKRQEKQSEKAEQLELFRNVRTRFIGS